MPTLSTKAFNLIRQYVHDQCGIFIEENKSYLIETRLSKFLVELKLDSFDELYEMIEKNKNSNFKMKIIDAITTNETLWFRSEKPWIVIEKKWLPKVIELIRTKNKKIRIWSAAVSTGQEIYSTVMFIDDYLKKNNIKDITLDSFEFHATDISESALEVAKKAEYDSITIMRGLNSYYREKYFTKIGNRWELNEDIKKRVRFDAFNLQNSFFFLGKFDLVFCRNVLIYFSEELKERIFEKISKIMNRDSILFVGASEIYNNMDKYFQKFDFNNSSYYAISDKI